jgi:ATP-dependent Lon protease
MAPAPEPRPAAAAIPDALPVLPVGDAFVFPLTASPVRVDEARSVRLVDDVMRGNRMLALVARKEKDDRKETDEPNECDSGPEDLYEIGTASVVNQLVRLPDGTLSLVVQGLERIRVTNWVETSPYLLARVEVVPDRQGDDTDVQALRHAVLDLLRRLVAGSRELPEGLPVVAEILNDPRHLVYFVAAIIRLSLPVRQELLEQDPVDAKLRRLLDLLQRDLGVRELGKKITSDTEERLTKSQREFFLREQLRSIHKELGEEEGEDDSTLELRRKVDEAGLPEEARREAERELKRLEGMTPASTEHGMTLTYLEWIASLPWNKTDGGPIDVRRARGVLDEDHYDLEKVKDRIVEYLAVKQLRQECHADAATPAARAEAARDGSGENRTPCPRSLRG